MALINYYLRLHSLIEILSRIFLIRFILWSDWFFRAKDANVRMAILADVLLHKRVHGKNESARVQQSSQDLLKQIRHSLHRKGESQKKQ